MSHDKPPEQEPLFTVFARDITRREALQFCDLTRAQALKEQSRLRATGDYRRVWMQQQKAGR